MSVGAFLAELRSHDMQVWADGDQLRCNAPAGVLTPELRDQLRKRKSDILEFLRSAEALAQQQRAIVPLQPRGERAPVFAVPGHNGDVFCYRALTQHLGDDQPFFGLQPPGLDGHSQPLGSVEDLAAYFAAQIRAFLPEGPYVIAGFCVGGTIAFELARQLSQQGAAISFVALFGSPYPTWYRFLPQLGERLAHQVERVSKHARALASLAHGDRRQYISETLRRRQARPAPTRLASSDPVLVLRARVEDASLAAARRYTPHHFAGRVSVFWPSKEWLRSGHALLRWRPVARHLEEYFGPYGCTGDSMLLEPHVPAIAELFRGCRDRSAVGDCVKAQTILARSATGPAVSRGATLDRPAVVGLAADPGGGPPAPHDLDKRLDVTTTLKTAVHRLAYVSRASAGWARGQARRRIVMFHGVTRQGAAEFERQLRYLTREFRVCSLRELLNPGGPASAVALTFDDGLRNHLTVVYPLLQKYRAPATFYVCPGLIDRGGWLWNHETRRRLLRMSGHVRLATATKLGAGGSSIEDVLELLKGLPSKARAGGLDVIRKATPGFTPTAEESEAFDLMTGDELRMLDPGLVTIGCHSMTHPILPTLEDHELAAEIAESRLALEQRLERPVANFFCYPSGSHDARVVSLVREHYESAVTAEQGLLAADADPYLLPRISAAGSVALLAWRMHRPQA